MPHFTLQMLPAGPMADAFIGVSQPRGVALLQAHQTIPALQQVRVLIDTGASGTCVDPSVLAALGLTPTGQVPVCSATSGTTPVMCDQYDVALMIPSPTGPFVAQTIPVTAHQLLAAQGFHALLGRDVLSRCVFIYNGTTHLFTLAY